MTGMSKRFQSLCNDVILVVQGYIKAAKGFKFSYCMVQLAPLIFHFLSPSKIYPLSAISLLCLYIYININVIVVPPL